MRKAMRLSTDHAAAQRAEPATKRIRARSQARRAPRRSKIQPLVGIVRTTARA
jgi:hypothetical protein